MALILIYNNADSGSPAMAFHLKRKESVPKGARRIALDQLDRAHDELTDPELDHGGAVHQARKRFKKIRAILRLVRPVLGKSRYRRHNRTFRDLGRALSGPRDAEVMVETLDKLLGSGAHEPAPPVFTGLRAHLEARRDAWKAERKGELEARMGEVEQALATTRPALERLPLGARGYDAVAPGLKRAYKRGRKALARAVDAPGDERFHELRKRVKDHWYHTRLLKKVWPDAMTCRAHLLKDLSDLLGDDHDLAVFRITLADAPAGALTTGERERLERLVVARQAQLRERAVPLARRVYAEKPRHHTRRISGYWTVWKGR